jgi:hypothetical protein
LKIIFRDGDAAREGAGKIKTHAHEMKGTASGKEKANIICLTLSIINENMALAGHLPGRAFKKNEFICA